MNARPATMIDVAFPVEGDTLPGDYRFALAEALDRALPWLADSPMAGVHRLNLVRNGGNDAMVSRPSCPLPDTACEWAPRSSANCGTTPRCSRMWSPAAMTRFSSCRQ
ncbi:MAG: Cas6 Crispr [Ramlibacter sp.]|nr:Cas6 Crispr [Ramlibacter sp.]